jgi:hypothetical protein
MREQQAEERKSGTERQEIYLKVKHLSIVDLTAKQTPVHKTDNFKMAFTCMY